MAIIKCKMCGGDIVLNEEKTLGTCEYCGTQMTLPKISDDQRAARFNRGNHFRRQGEFDKALAVYESIVREDDSDAEAHWCCALCRFGIEYVEDPNTYDYLPTCHRASFDSFLEDVDYLAALEHSNGITRRQYQKDAAKIAEVQRGILATSQNEEPFDVFICYKETDDETGERTRDSLDAQEIYYQLTQAGYRVFFSRISLEDKAGTEYEPYIFAALNSAKVMVVVGSKSEYYNAVWVKNEWSRFLAIMRKDRSKLLLPCYKNMDPYDLPEQLAVLQSYDLAKIGFMQDLIRGVKKVLDKDVKQVVSQPVIQQSSVPIGPNVTALIKRGQQALEDREWGEAARFYDQVMNIDAENPMAFFGKALAAARCSNTEEFTKNWTQLSNPKVETLVACKRDDSWITRVEQECAVPGFLSAIEIDKCFTYDIRTYESLTAAWTERIEQVKNYWKNDRMMSRAVRFAKGDFSEMLIALRDKIEHSLQSSLKESEATDERLRAEVIAKYNEEMKKAEKKAEELRSITLAECLERERQGLIAQAEWENKKLKNYQSELNELTNIRGMFSGKVKQEKRKKELETKIAEQEREVSKLLRKLEELEKLKD